MRRRSTIRDNLASEGAGIYLAEGGKLYLSGSPIFDANLSETAALGANAKNGGEAYAEARQDIYLAGCGSADAPSIAVTGNLTGPDGSIWVWAEQARHYQQNKQFAVMEGGRFTGLTAFRNAQTDAATGNKTDGYLYGISYENDARVYWFGVADLTVTKTVSGEMGEMDRAFAFTLSGLTNGKTYTAVFTNADHVSETRSYTVASGKLSFSLKNGEQIVLKTLPLGKSLTLKEDTLFYTVSWKKDNVPLSGNARQVTLVLSDDTRFDVTNTLAAISPTGYRGEAEPFAWMLAFGVLLLGAAAILRRKKEQDA